MPEHVFVTVAKEGENPNLYEALQTSRPDVAARYGRSSDENFGYSRLIDVHGRSGAHVIGLARMSQGRLESCQLSKTFLLSETK